MSARQNVPGIPPGRGRGRPILGQGASNPSADAAPENGLGNHDHPPPQPVLNHVAQQFASTPPNNGSGDFAQPPPTAAYSNLSVNAAVFVPRQCYATSPDPTVVLQQAIQDLTRNPALFDDTLPALKATFNVTIQTEEKLKEIIEIIVEKGITEPNFRYTAARLCAYFSIHYTAQYTHGNFRQHLLKKCHEEHGKRIALSCDSKIVHRLLGFTIFMGELLLSMMTSSGQPIVVIANAIHELLELLMSIPDETTLKCIVQALKLTGAILDDVEAAGNADQSKPKMDDLIAQIKLKVVDETPTRRTKRMLLSVVELRAELWCRHTITEAASTEPPPSDAVVAGGVYYGENGETYTYEDTNFIPASDAAEAEATEYFAAENADSRDWYSYTNPAAHQPWSNNDGGGLDPEAEAAYDEFLYAQQMEQNNAANNY